MKERPWVSNFESGQLVCGTRMGIRPLGQVYGCCVERVTTLYFPITSMEASVEASAFDEALAKCKVRLREEAVKLGANAILGCHLEWKRLDDMFPPSDTSYYFSSLKVTGTAAFDPASTINEIYLSTLDMTDVFALRKAGYQPAGLAVGRCTYYQVAWKQIPKMTGGAISTWANEEIVELTQGPYAAREIAMSRMSEMAQSIDGIGVVGVKVNTEVIPTGSLQTMSMAATCRFLCLGTAIRRKPGAIENGSISALVPLK